MKPQPLPLPVRVAAGLVATAVEQVRDLPRLAVELPVTAVSQALQTSMRVQQTITDLAIKGDRVLGMLRPLEEKPSWATFDEDLEEDGGRPTNGVTPLRRPEPERIPVARPPAPVTAAAAEPDGPEEPDGPSVLPKYPELSIPQLRARLRSLTVDDLRLLLAWENAHEARPAYVTMLTNRIATVTAS
ncbi:lipid droplet-associated protein [Pseudonocardia sp.]|uniref:lipid droplet-associated protein n=1 Tax=Pseudonocardia sp. TaxID=60912 RepID=UPI003D0A3285